jgi:hypothetical protein
MPTQIDASPTSGHIHTRHQRKPLELRLSAIVSCCRMKELGLAGVGQWDWTVPAHAQWGVGYNFPTPTFARVAPHPRSPWSGSTLLTR